MNRITTYFSTITILLLVIAMNWNCKKNETIGADNKPPGDHISRADGARLYTGENRALIVWANKDSKVTAAKIFWNHQKDSLVYTINPTIDSVKIHISNLEEGTQKFDIVTVGDHGVSSGKTILSGYIYGLYTSKLGSITLKDTLYYSYKNTVELTWEKQNIPNAIGTQVVYTDVNGNEQKVFYGLGDSLSLVRNISKQIGGALKYHTAYWFENGLDTIYAEGVILPAAPTTFINPVVRGADPWMARKDSMYYLMYTTGSYLEIRVSKKVFNLGTVAPVRIWTPPSGTTYASNIWAPELHEIDGKWYIYFAADDGNNANHRMYVLVNASPDPLKGQWVFKGKIAETVDQWAIDGSVFKYKDQLYMVWSGGTAGAAPQRIYIAKMSNPWTIDGSSIVISTPTFTWERNGAAINEGPQPLYNASGKLFIVFSGSSFASDQYCLGLLTLKDNGDPLNPSNWAKTATPIFSMSAASNAYGPGHNGFFKSPDGTEDWIVYHARRYPGGGSTNYRNIRMQKFTWNSNGTPNFGTPVAVGASVTKPSGAY